MEGLGHSNTLELKNTFTAIRKSTVRALRKSGGRAWSLELLRPAVWALSCLMVYKVYKVYKGSIFSVT